MRRREFGFNLQLLSDSEIPIKEVHCGCPTEGTQVYYFTSLLCHHFDNKQYWTCWFLQCFFCRKEVGMQKNTWPLRNGCRMLCSSPFLGAEKGMTPTTICVSPPSLINNRSLNTPHQRHYSSYLLISAFWGGVVKDREAPFIPNYVHLKSHVITRFFLSAKVVEF